MHTSSSAGTYFLGLNRGRRTAVTPKTPIFTHSFHPSATSLGVWMYVANGHTSRYKYIAKAVRRITMFDLVAAGLHDFASKE